MGDVKDHKDPDKEWQGVAVADCSEDLEAETAMMIGKPRNGVPSPPRSPPPRVTTANETTPSNHAGTRQAKCLGVPMKWVSLLLLVAQTVGVVFMMRLSRTAAIEGPRYLNTTAVFFSEVLKIACSFMLLAREEGDFVTAFHVVFKVFGDRRETLKICVPSLLYTVQNNLLFVSLSNLSGAVYQVSYQLKILTTAMLSVAILGKQLSKTQWGALCCLTSGVALIQVPVGGKVAVVSAGGNTAVGLAAVFSACMTSGLAGVYLEKILKQTSASIWLRNIQLGVISAFLAIAGCYLTDGSAIKKHGFTQGYNSLVVTVIFLQAIGGMVVAAVLKYADNILKCFGNALSIVISCVLSSILLQEFDAGALFVVGTMMVLAATGMYSLGLPAWCTRQDW